MLHRWPQGRIIRTICLVLVAGVALDLGLGSALWLWLTWWKNVASAGAFLLLVYAIISTLISLAVLVGGVAAVGFIPRSVDFLIEVEQEMAKVTWPKSNDVVRSTIIIALMTVVMTLLIYLVDFFNALWVYEWLFGTSGKA